MADRLTQLQDAVNQQADNFCNSIGILQQCSQPSLFSNFEKPSGKSSPPPPQEGLRRSRREDRLGNGSSRDLFPRQSSRYDCDYAVLFSKLIARTAKDIDVLIESLPNEESSYDLQTNSLKKLELENQDAARKLEDVVRHGEVLLEQIQQALHDIAQAQLNCQDMETT